MKKLKETTSPLLNRTRVEYEIDHFQRATPKKDELKKQLAAELKTPEDSIYLKHVYSHFGLSKSKIVADVYKSKQDLEKYTKIKKKVKKEAAVKAPKPEAKEEKKA